VADFIFEAANDPAVSPEVHSVFLKRGIFDINDFIANNRGVVVSYAELNRLLQPETLLIESVERVLERILPLAKTEIFYLEQWRLTWLRITS
jgi:glutamate dehydrogenase/leucine dehydrogenase